MQEQTIAVTRGDNVHISSDVSSGRTASAHGWWEKGTTSATLADVTADLQVLNNGNWITVATHTRRVAPGTYRRANPRILCRNSYWVNWRSVIDVDLVGIPDTPNKLVTPVKYLQCGT